MNAKTKRLSIVVPVFNEEGAISGFLQQLRTTLSAAGDVEVLVVDGGSSDRTVALAEECGVSCLQGPKGRARQMNYAASRACGEYLLFLHCDTQLPMQVMETFKSLSTAGPAWGFFALRLSGSGSAFRVIEWAISWRSRLTGIATGDQAIFVHQDLWQQVEGYRELALMEDVDLSSRLRGIRRPQVQRRTVKTSSRRWEQRGVVKTVCLMWFLRACFCLGVSDRTLARWYR